MYATVEPDYVESSYLDNFGDPDLVRLVKTGNDDALGLLLRRHREALYRFCLHLVPNRDDAEDICQESLARAMMRVDSLHTGSAFRSWLFSIARNLSIDSYRSKRRLCALPDEELSPLPLPLYQESPYERIEVHEEYQTVAEALGKLKKNHQTVLMMREVEGLSYAEIAARLDVTQSAVETLLFRARKRLREEYGKTGASVPAVAFLGSFRSMLSRLTTPFGGAPLAAKVAVTVMIVGGAAVASPRVLTFVHASHSQPAPVTRVLPNATTGSHAFPASTGSPHSSRPSAATSPSRQTTAGHGDGGSTGTQAFTAVDHKSTYLHPGWTVPSPRHVANSGGHNAPSTSRGPISGVKIGPGAKTSPRSSVPVRRIGGSRGQPISSVTLSPRSKTAGTSGTVAPRSYAPAPRTGHRVSGSLPPSSSVPATAVAPSGQAQGPVTKAVTGVQVTGTQTTSQVQTAVNTTGNQVQTTVNGPTGQVKTAATQTVVQVQSTAKNTTNTVTGATSPTTGRVQTTVNKPPVQVKKPAVPKPAPPPDPAPRANVPVATPVVAVPRAPTP